MRRGFYLNPLSCQLVMPYDRNSLISKCKQAISCRNGHIASISYYDSFSEQIYTRRKNKAVFNLM